MIDNLTQVEWDALTRAAEVAHDVWKSLDGFRVESAALNRALVKAGQLAPEGAVEEIA